MMREGGNAHTGLVAKCDFTTLDNERQLAVDGVGIALGLLSCHFAD